MKPAHISYRIIDDSEWTLLNDTIRSSEPEVAYWTVRTYGLDGTISFDLPYESVPWGGFLLDLACALVGWLDADNANLDWYPMEQANQIRFDQAPTDLVIRTGLREGHVSNSEARSMVSDWLDRLALDVRTRAPRLGSVPGFEWVGRFGAPSDDHERVASG